MSAYGVYEKFGLPRVAWTRVDASGTPSGTLHLVSVDGRSSCGLRGLSPITPLVRVTREHPFACKRCFSHS